MRHLLRLLVLLAALAPGAATSWAGFASRVVAGLDHTCALTADGTVVCWGANFYGQLGDGTKTDRLVPTVVSGLGSGVAAIAAGGYHTCALTAGGGVLCWGYNDDGGLGDGTTTERLVPTAVSGLASGVAAIAAGGYHTCALTTEGGVACWGSNSLGQLGDGTTEARLVPTAVSGLGMGVAAITAGGNYSCALTTGGAVVCWGSNWYGQLGDGTTESRLTPAAVSGLGSGATAVATGWDHTCALTAGGGAVCWGSNWFAALGDGTTEDRLTPTAVSGLSRGVVAVSAGVYHTCALTSDGAVSCWGAIGYAGSGDLPPYDATPTAVAGLGSGIASIAAGGFHQCALSTSGGVACWGYNGWGEIGDGTDIDRPLPALVLGLEGSFRTAGDFTGDAKSDILWRHSTQGDVWLWPMDGAARTAETYVRTVADTDWEIRGLGDQDGDGMADLLWRNKTTGQIYFWPMDGSTPLDEIYVTTVDPAYDIVGTGDFDGDGKSDILWRHLAGGDLWIWLMDGATPLSETYVDSVDLAYVVKGVADLDANGKADIVFHHPALGEVWVWPMNGATRLSQHWVGTVPDAGYRMVGVADHTGDGRADVLWHHDTRGEVWLWTMNGTALVGQTYVDTVPDTGYRIAGSGDYDGDGKADILWHHDTRGEVWVWLMDGPVKLNEACVGTVPDTGYQIVKVR